MVRRRRSSQGSEDSDSEDGMGRLQKSSGAESARRAQHPERGVYHSKSVQSMLVALRVRIPRSDSTDEPTTVSSTAVMFPVYALARAV